MQQLFSDLKTTDYFCDFASCSSAALSLQDSLTFLCEQTNTENDSAAAVHMCNC